MTRCLSALWQLAAVAAVLLPFAACLSLPSILSSNMVLQRAPRSAQLWGSATAGSVVTVTLDGAQAQQALAQQDGSWSLQLSPQPAGVDRSLNVTGDGQTVQLSNIAFGEVFLCAGQSNMQFTTDMSFTGNESVADSGQFPHLRLLSLANTASLTPLNDTAPAWSDGQAWVASQPRYVGGCGWCFFSAVCFYQGRSLYRALNVDGAVLPVGLISSTWGGTVVEAWSSPDALSSCGPLQPPAADGRPRSHRHQRERPSAALAGTARGRSLLDTTPPTAAAGAAVSIDPNTPSVLWNGMVAPLTRLSLAGVSWYQAESNWQNASSYACRWPAMIRDWREKFGDGRLHFNFVLIAAVKNSGFPTWPLLRDAQLAALQLPYTAVASAQDLGDDSSPEGAVHPRNKTVLGERLAGNALRHLLGWQRLVADGPQAADVVWPVPGPVQTVIVRFSAALPANAGLRLLDTSQCDFCCRNVSGSAMTVYTSDGQRRRAAVTVLPAAFTVLATVDLSGLPETRIVSVQHGWEEYQQCALYNQHSIPMLPFNIARP